jgi:hypothetical protein
MLKRAAWCWNALRDAETRCVMLKHAAWCWNTLRDAETRCVMLKHAAWCWRSLCGHYFSFDLHREKIVAKPKKKKTRTMTDRQTDIKISCKTLGLQELLFPGDRAFDELLKTAISTHAKRNTNKQSLDTQRVLITVRPLVTGNMYFCRHGSSVSFRHVYFSADKRNVHPRTGREGRKQNYKYISTPSLISPLVEGEWSASGFGRFTPGNDPGTHWTEGLVGPRRRCGSFGRTSIAPTRIQTSDLSAVALSHYLRHPPIHVQPYIQGSSNMTGTNCDLFTHNQSRSYLNHLKQTHSRASLISLHWLTMKDATTFETWVNSLPIVTA